MKRLFTITSLVILLLSLTTACGRRGPDAPPDKTPPEIAATNPVLGSIDVPSNTAISVTFSKAVIEKTISFLLMSKATGTVPCTMSYSDKTATFTPSNALAYNTQYFATISAGVTDTLGNVMPSDYAWSFTTGAVLAPTTMLLSSPSVTYSSNGIVTISVSSGGGIPIGGASLSVDGGIAVVQELTGGSTTFTIPSPGAGTHTLNAAYAAQGNFGASSASGTLIVNQAATTTSITAPAVTFGANGIVTVTVSSAAGTPTGNVSLSVDGGVATTQVLSGGSTIFTIPSPTTGTHTLNAAYAAQGNFGASSASGTLGVGVGATTMTLSAPGVTYNANGIVTVTVSSATTPTGSVSLRVDGGAATTQVLSGGSTAFTIPSPSAGTHTLNAAYAAQGTFGASSASGTLFVNQAATTTTITAPAVTFGANGIVTVTVSSAAGTPIGNVSLSVDGGVATTQVLSGGSATFTITSPSFGSHSLIATYAAQGNFGASQALGTLGVGPGATAMTLSAPTITYGADGSVTVTVSSTAGTPTGSVSLRVDNGTATTQGLINGSTIFTILSPSAGTHTLNAAYAAQGNFGASSASGTLIVNKAATTTTITAPAVTFGANGIVTVTVSSAAGTPTGNVSLSVDGGAATTQALAGGSATFTITSPSAGTHTLNAAYAAQGNFGASSASGTLGVGVGATTMTISAPGVTYGANGIVTVTVGSAAGTPTGNVTLSVDGGTATTQALSGGSTTFTITSPSAGTHTLNAAYAAQGNFGASSASGTLTVIQASTSTGVTSSLNPSNFGDSVTFTATVTPSTATGTVTFKDGATVLGTDTLSGGLATFSTSSLTGGVHSITAEYAGDTNFVASTSSILSQTVNYAIIATAGPHGSISPSGTVSVSSGADQPFTITPQNGRTIVDVLVDGVSQGPVASYTFTNVTANHTISASFL